MTKGIPSTKAGALTPTDAGHAAGLVAEATETVVAFPSGIELNGVLERIHGAPPDAVWRYLDESGNAILVVARWDSGNGKAIRPLTRVRASDGSEKWQFKQHPEPRPLYNLDRLASQPDSGVLIVEGEKAADAAQKIFPKWVVTTWPGGSNAVEKADWAILAGRYKVVIWPDNDDPGKKAAKAVGEKLQETGVSSILVVDAQSLASVDKNGRARPAEKGWDAADAADDWQDQEKLAELVLKLAAPLPAYRSCDKFTMNEGGLFVTLGNKSARVSAPFEIVARERDARGERWSKLLRWCDADNKGHTATIPDADLFGDGNDLCRKLADKGLSIDPENKRYLPTYLHRIPVEDRSTSVTNSGWHEIEGDRVFVLPERVIGGHDNIIRLTGGSSAPFGSKGNISDWSGQVAAPVLGQTRLMFMLSAAFVGPLLEPLGKDGFGFHLYGNSSTGKTTAIRVAASVWGRGSTKGSSGEKSGFVQSWRNTGNAIERKAALHTDTLLVLDEISVADPQDVGAMAYQLTAGTSKGRLTRDSELKEAITWRTPFLSTGEVRLEDKLKQKGLEGAAGQGIRMLEIDADAGAGFGVFDTASGLGDPKTVAETMTATAQVHYGTAGPAFVENLISTDIWSHTANLRGLISEFRRQVAPVGADGQVQRAADAFGVVAAAGELAIDFGILPWTAGAARNAAARLFREWLKARGNLEPQEVQDAISKVRLFIQKHGNSRFESIDNGSPASTMHNRAGYRRGSGTGEEWLIPGDVWKNEVTRGSNPVRAARWLVYRGMLKRARDGFQSNVKIHGRQVKVYIVTAKILEGGDGDA